MSACNNTYGSCFKIKFNILDYMDVCPMPPTDIREYINWDKPQDKCVWKKSIPDVITSRYKQQETIRVLRTGVWIIIKSMPVWLPPNYYYFLQYFTTGGKPPQFRLKRLKQIYFKLRVRSNPKALGTYTIKNRQDGETTIAMSDAMWECCDGNMDFGAIGIQSKTRKTVTESCWRSLTMGWNSLDQWVKDLFYPDIVSQDQIAEKMKFQRPKTLTDTGRDILLTYGASTHNAFDSLNNMRKCILDEVNKWEECSFYATFLNYEKFIAPGTERKGIFDIFSSPADTAGRHNDEAYAFWKNSNPDELTDFGSTRTRIFRWYSNPLEGIEGCYDEFGDADGEVIYKIIMQKRADTDKEFLMGEIRGYPLNESEMFGSTDQQAIWSNTEGLKARAIYLIGTRFKNAATKEPIGLYGNLERVEGYIDGDVEFRAADVQKFDEKDARFFIPFLPQNREPLKDIFNPPNYVESSLGVDPIQKRHRSGNKMSNPAMVNWKFRDIHDTKILKCPTLIYCIRPQHAETFYEDAIKAAVFNRSLVQVEDINDKIIDWFEDRGYMNWLLPKIGEKKDSKIKGDSPTGGGRNAFLEEMIGLMDAVTNTPLTPDDPYLLEQFWSLDLINDLLKFNSRDTHENDLSMAFGQALIGAVKITFRKQRQKNPVTGGILNYILS